MNRILAPGPRSGQILAPASKSQLHRLLICAALGERETLLQAEGNSRDIASTAACLTALGARIEEENDGILRVIPISRVPKELCHMPCGESGTSLRFLLPVAGVLGAKAVFHREGRLPERPIAPLIQQLSDHGMRLWEKGEDLYCEGQLQAGEYCLPGNQSSQFISGLLLALPCLPRNSSISITGTIESAAYLALTGEVLDMAGVKTVKDGSAYQITGGQQFCLPRQVKAEGDWSSAAFFLCMGALSPDGVTLEGLSLGSRQGDRAILKILRGFGAVVEAENGSVFVRRGKLHGQRVDATQIPDLIPAVCAVAAAAEGETRIVNAGRLRMKESDRLNSITQMLTSQGADITELSDGLIIHGKKMLSGGIVDSAGDHRIAMAAAVSACVCQNAVTVQGAECVEKSYPRFWEDWKSLKGETA